MKKITLALALTALFLSSCEKYLDINTDPAVPQEANAEALLPPMLASMVRGEAFDTRYVGKYVQNFSQSTSLDTWDRMGYIFNSSDVGGEKWSTHYFRIGLNVDLTVNDATKRELWDYVGAAKAIRAWSWQSTADEYGEMIVKQAWEPNRYSFNFDPQEEAYIKGKQEAEEALKFLERTDGKPSTLRLGDLVYKGDRAKWIKFTNGVLARHELRYSNKSTFNPDKVIELCNKSLASNADNFDVPHDGTSTANANFFGPTRNNMGGFRPTTFFVNLLNGVTFDPTATAPVPDPRLAGIIAASPDGIIRGILPTQGDPNNTTGNTRRTPTFWATSPAVTATAANGKFVFQDKANFLVMSYAEIQFIKAEAAFRKGDRVMALDAYQKGITANLDYVSGLLLTADERTLYATQRTRFLTSKGVAQTAAVLTMSDIMLQKYIALFMNGAIETWVDMRRHNYNLDIYKGFTVLTPTQLFPDNNGKLVYRLRPRYNSEFIWNRDQLAAIGGTQLDYHTKPVWFSVP